MQCDGDKELSARHSTLVIYYLFLCYCWRRVRIYHVMYVINILFYNKKNSGVLVFVCAYVCTEAQSLIIIIITCINTGPRRCADDIYVRASFRVRILCIIVVLWGVDKTIKSVTAVRRTDNKQISSCISMP